jgi:hypothetical protein
MLRISLEKMDENFYLCFITGNFIYYLKNYFSILPVNQLVTFHLFLPFKITSRSYLPTFVDPLPTVVSQPLLRLHKSSQARK